MATGLSHHARGRVCTREAAPQGRGLLRGHCARASPLALLALRVWDAGRRGRRAVLAGGENSQQKKQKNGEKNKKRQRPEAWGSRHGGKNFTVHRVRTQTAARTRIFRKGLDSMQQERPGGSQTGLLDRSISEPRRHRPGEIWAPGPRPQLRTPAREQAELRAGRGDGTPHRALNRLSQPS